MWWIVRADLPPYRYAVRLLSALILITVFSGMAEAREQSKNSEDRERRHVIWLAPEFSVPSGLDEGFSLYPRLGPALGMKLGYDYRGRVFVNEFSLGGKYIWLDAPYGLIEKDLGIHLFLRDNVLFPINLPNLPLRLYPGAALGMVVNVWFPQDRLNFSFQNYLALDALFRIEWDINEKHSLRGGIAFPVLGVSWRPAWAAYTTAIERSLREDGILGPLFIFPKFFSLHNLQSITLDLRYTWKLSKLLNLYADYRFFYMHDNSARPYQLLDHGLSLGVEFKL